MSKFLDGHGAEKFNTLLAIPLFLFDLFVLLTMMKELSCASI